MPPESMRRADVGLRAQVEDVHHLAGAAARVGAVHAVVAAVVEQRLLDVEEAVEVDVLLGQADDRRASSVSCVVAEDAHVAGVTRMRLQTALISVVLPAPLGPSSPKNAPSGTVRSKSSSARRPSS